MNPYEFENVYWNHFLNIEQKIMATKTYVDFDDINKNTFSIIYLDIYLSICSEIDVICKEFCRSIDPSFNGDNIIDFCECITNTYPQIINHEVQLKGTTIKDIPWENWIFNGNDRSKNSTPKWWKIYNNIKHKRTSKDVNDVYYYKYANQDNVLLSFFGLFVLEMYMYKHIVEINDTTNIIKTLFPKSKLLKMNNWDDRLLYDDLIKAVKLSDEEYSKLAVKDDNTTYIITK
jgi:hypothetical protein